MKKKFYFSEDKEKEVRSLAAQEAIKLMLAHLDQWHKETEREK